MAGIRLTLAATASMWVAELELAVRTHKRARFFPVTRGSACDFTTAAFPMIGRVTPVVLPRAAHGIQRMARVVLAEVAAHKIQEEASLPEAPTTAAAAHKIPAEASPPEAPSTMAEVQTRAESQARRDRLAPDARDRLLKAFKA